MSRDTVESIITNAERLLNDAKILRDAGSFRTATSLAILSVEESGKACVVHWKFEGLITESVAEALRRCHADKQRVFAIYKFCQAVQEIVIPYLIHHLRLATENPAHRPSGDGMLELCAKAGYERADRLFFRAETGIDDYVKQLGLYVDIDENLEVIAPFGEPGPDEATSHIDRAEDAIAMARGDDLLHRAMAAVFRETVTHYKVNRRAFMDKVIQRQLATVRDGRPEVIESR